MIDEHTAMDSLYQVANTQPYMPSTYSTTAREFTPDPLLVSQAKEFKPDPLFAVPVRSS